ncbi:hypothetical protein Q8W71_10690 [Methylobacterium sp. NEAU 140]|uniref:hypothetical protein n=1 Tax=Methylobacterium sp. NEAU 140 TaxID=3064945 RepID=UPI002732E75E|nr:hypothetical protein [Methylobacterium sp. NEAU 140]MDP4023091.1 hypothetical protein [Methylobacterium sp. NEAU 140]
MRSLKIALLGALATAGLGALTTAPAQAQDGYGAGRFYSVSRPLPIRVRPRSWLDAGPAPLASNVPGAGGSRNPALNPYLIAASNALTPPYGPTDRFGRGVLPDPITNAPFITRQQSAVRNVDLSFVDRLDPTSPLYGRPY